MSAVKAKVQQFRSPSPLLKKTERRRSRSRSRQRIDSELLRKVDEIKMIHDTMEYLISTYGVVKDSNPLLKQSLQRSEEAAFWVRQKAGEAIVAANLEQPIKQIDAAAARSLEKIEEKRGQLRSQWEQANRQWQSRVKSFFLGVQRATDGARNSVLESVQTTLDYIEETFEPVLLPASPEAAKYSEDTSPLVAMRRMLDITFRLHMGILKKSADGVKTTLAPGNLEKYVRPSKILTRLSIVRQEVFTSHQLGYLENKELTEVDRGVIAAGRFAVRNVQDTVDAAKKRNAALVGAAGKTYAYSTDVFRQLREAKTWGDVSGIGIHESRLALETVRERVPWRVFDSALAWLKNQEKKLE